MGIAFAAAVTLGIVAPVGAGGPLPLTLDTVVIVATRRVVLVTLDEDAGMLVVRTSLPRS